MNVQELKEYLLDNNCVEQVLESIGCHSIINHGNYISCANYNGDNVRGVIVYLNENITVINYTRSILKNKNSADIFDLIKYNQDCSSANYDCSKCSSRYECDLSKKLSKKDHHVYKLTRLAEILYGNLNKGYWANLVEN